MESQLELIQFDDNIPFKFEYLNLGNIKSHWHNELEIIFILSGKLTVILSDKRFILNPEDIIVINKNTTHALSSQNGCVAFSLKLNIQNLNDSNLYFDCNSAVDSNKGYYYNLKHLIAKLVKENSSDSRNYFQNMKLYYSILEELSKKFYSTPEESKQSKKYLERLTKIIEYIDEHYKEAITLNQLADIANLSVPYLSAFFEKYLGVNFLTYYNELRLDHAVNELLSSDESVEVIASNNGFTDSRSFVNLFKKKYGTLPSKFRKDSGKIKSEETKSYDSKDLKNEGYLSILAKYLSSEKKSATENQNTASSGLLLQKPETLHFDSDYKIITKENIDVSGEGIQLRHTFKRIISISRAKEILFNENQKLLQKLQKEIGYEYLKFHGLMADDMQVYREDKNGNPILSFNYVDQVIDFLLSINLKPIMQFSFTPLDLASDKSKNVYSSPFNVSYPKDLKKWQYLIKELTLHLIKRYSADVVKDWPFCTWSEPDTTKYLFGFETDEQYYDLYKISYDTIKEIDSRFRFGSPSLLISYDHTQKWTCRFINWCKENNCIPDYMNINYYENDFTIESISSHTPAHPSHSRLNKDENSFRKCIQKVRNMFAELGISQLPVYLTEWNLTVSHRNLLNDTCFKACYLTKNLLENYDQLDSFGYWVLTDLNEEIQPSNDEFHGGLGLFTNNGIKKPHYYAFYFINQLGNRLIEKGDGFFISRSSDKIQIMLYNYEHFSHLFASGETYDMTFTERYTPFSKQAKMEVYIELVNINAKKCTIREHVINQQFGSAFDKWIEMGAQELSKEDIEYLKNISQPGLFVHQAEIQNNALPINVMLGPLEVRFIEISLL